MDIKVKSHLKPCAALSIAIMIVALVMTLTGHGMNLGVDFTGGTIMTYNMGEQFETADVEAVLADNGITDAQIAKTGDNDTQVQIRISDKENTDDLRAALESALGEKYAGMEYVDISRVGAIAGRDLINNAIKSVSLAAVLDADLYRNSFRLLLRLGCDHWIAARRGHYAFCGGAVAQLYPRGDDVHRRLADHRWLLYQQYDHHL